MSKEHKAWARRARQRLLEKLGMFCAHCGRTDDLEFDCIVPMGDDHHRKSTDQRMCFYHRQHRDGNVQVLCSKCNAKKGDDVVDCQDNQLDMHPNLLPLVDYPF